MRLSVSLLVMLLLSAGSVSAHHSNSAFYVEKIIELKGIVTKFEWINPHRFLSMTVDDGKGAKVEWTVEGRGTGVLRRAGGNGTL